MENNGSNGMLYAIRVDRVARYNTAKSGLYISWCNDNWHECTKDPTPRFDYKTARDIANKLADQYVFSVTLIDQNGVLDSVSHLRRGRLVNLDIPIKKSIFVINKDIFAAKKSMF